MLNTNIFHLLTFIRQFGFGILRANSYYTRNIEYPLCFNKLKLEKNLRILDIGSGHSVFPLYLAWRGILTYAVDIDEYILELKELAKRFSLGYLLDTRRMNIEVCDVRKLNFSDNFFDRISAISTLEHIPGDGDIKAMQEIRRVLKSGGRVFLSVEAHKKFIEIPVVHNFYYGYPYKNIIPLKSIQNQDIYANSYKEFKGNKNLKSIGFVRYYNTNALFERIIKPSGLEVEEIGYFADTFFSFRKLFDNTHLNRYFSFFVPLIARLCYRRIEFEKIQNSESYLSNAIAFILLQKP